MVVIGVAKHNADFNFLELQRKELNVFGSRGATKADFAATMKLVKDGFVRFDQADFPHLHDRRRRRRISGHGSTFRRNRESGI